MAKITLTVKVSIGQEGCKEGSSSYQTFLTEEQLEKLENKQLTLKDVSPAKPNQMVSAAAQIFHNTNMFLGLRKPRSR